MRDQTFLTVSVTFSPASSHSFVYPSALPHESSSARTIFERTFHGPYGLRKDYYAGALPGYLVPAIGYVIGVLLAAYTPLGPLWMSAFGLMLGLLFHVLSSLLARAHACARAMFD